MGVQGLWKLLESAGKPIAVEKLENKVLSIDVSIWLYQILKGVQDSEHGATTNVHLVVMFHRICKLLFYGIKPIFVFDGGVPELKKITIAQRQARKSRAKKSTGKTKEKILKNMLEQAAIQTVMNTGNAMTEDEVISKTVNSLNKVTETDLFELPKMPEVFEIDTTVTPTKENDEKTLNSSNKRENILLLAVENQVNDFLYTDIGTKDKEKTSSAKLNDFSSLQIGELLNGFSCDQKRLSERKKQQKAKQEMTVNELESFLNNSKDDNKIIEEYSQRIDSDYDTVYYYESGFNKSGQSSSSKSNEMYKSTKTFSQEKSVGTEPSSTSQKILNTDAIGSPTLTEDIDDDIFKALAGDESLEEDRLAWLIFNENKKASKRRSSEFELPNLKCSKTHTNSNSAEVSTSDVPSDIEENICVKNNKAVSTNVSKSIFITEDDLSNEKYFDNFNEEDYLSWVSHSKDEPSELKLENKEPSISLLDIPSTSKSIVSFKENNSSNKMSYENQQDINESLYFQSKFNKTGDDVFYNTSPSIESDISNGSFSENSVDFSPPDFSSEESLSNDVSKDYRMLLDKRNQQEHISTDIVQGLKRKSDSLSNDKTEFNDVNSTKKVITKKLKSPTKLNKNSTTLMSPVKNETSPVDEQYLLSIQDTLVKHQNDLASLQRTSDRMASSVTQKMTSQIKNLLKLFGIPYITAPMEAEAQCAFLERIGRTEGTVTDDSDVWLFGADVVYKDFFDSKKYVKQFKSIDIKQKFALSRNSFIQLAFLVGSDYTNGIDGIGPVSAIEILSFFESKTKNMNIEEKLLKIKEIANSKSDVYSDVPFVKKLKSTRIGNDFPNKAVINAYLNPIVNESNDKFQWGVPQVDSIIQFAQTNFDWDISKTKRTLAPVLKKVSERTTQKSLDSYVKILPELSNTNTGGMSKRVNLAVKRLRNDSSLVETNSRKSDNAKKTTSKKKTSTEHTESLNKKLKKNLK